MNCEYLKTCIFGNMTPTCKRDYEECGVYIRKNETILERSIKRYYNRDDAEFNLPCLGACDIGVLKRLEELL